MSQSSTLDVGLDVHQESIAVASVAKDHDAEVIDLGAMSTRPCDIDQLVRTRQSTAQRLVFVYEAGPCGYWWSRDLTKKGDVCWVVAPALMPQTAGDRVKPDRRDAVPLARLMRSGALTPVDVPQVADDALHDRTRARADTIRALHTATCRLKAFWLRHDIRSTGRATWRPAHLRWLREVGGPTPAPPIVFQAYVRALTEHAERLQRLAPALHEQVTAWRLDPVVDALQALRGVPFTVVVTTVAALGDLTRVENPRQLMKCLGLSPSESSSGARRRQGSLTTAGHPHARRAVVEGAWAYRDPAKVSRHVPLRLEQLPNPIQDISWKAHVRLCQRFRRVTARGNHANQVVVAIARELAGWMWAIATEIAVTPSASEIACYGTNRGEGFHRASAAAPPRCGATLDGVTRPAGTLAPRVRPAPDGCQSGGTPSTDLSRITRRF